MRKILIALVCLYSPLAARAAGHDASRYAAGENPWLGKELTRAELMPSVEAASSYFLRNQLGDGQFVFLKDPLGRCCRDKPEKYSLIRHLGAVYAQLRTFELTKNPDYLKSARLGTRFTERFRGPDGGVQVVKDLAGKAGIGENGFLLINTVLHDALSGETTFAATSDDLSRWLTKNLRYGGPLATAGEWAECQAIIGLAHYYKYVKKDPAILTAIRSWLTASMKAKKHSHWSVQAASWYLAIEPEAVTRDKALLDYAVDTTDKLLANVTTLVPGVKSRHVGAKKNGWGGCGVTARNEGLVAGHVLARALGRRGDASRLLTRVKEHIAHALQFQYGQVGNLYENDAVRARMGRLFQLHGAVFDDPRDGYVRIDYVSHHVRAIAAYLSLPNAPVDVGLRMSEIAGPSL